MNETDGDRKARLDDIRSHAADPDFGTEEERFLLAELERVERKAQQYEPDAREWMEQRDAARAELELLRVESFTTRTPEEFAAWKQSERDAATRLAERAETQARLEGLEAERDHYRLGLTNTQARVKELEGALTALLGFLDEHGMSLRPDMDAMLRAALAGGRL